MNGEDLTKERWRASLAAWLEEAAESSLLSRLLGPGRPLDPGTQRRMEALWGRDLSQVVIHDTRQAGEIAERLGAEAFTVGPRIFAAPERLVPETPRGWGLLAHELTHVVQQTHPSPVSAVYPLLAGQPMSPPSTVAADMAPGSFTLDTGRGSAQPQIQRQAASASGGPAAEPDAAEAQAQAVEQATQEMAQEGIRPAAVDPHHVADRVYRLMQEDLRLERERRAF